MHSKHSAHTQRTPTTQSHIIQNCDCKIYVLLIYLGIDTMFTYVCIYVANMHLCGVIPVQQCAARTEGHIVTLLSVRVHEIQRRPAHLHKCNNMYM